VFGALVELAEQDEQFDERAGWNNGFLSCAHWLHWRTGIDLGAAREKVRVAKALAELPRLSDAMRRGTISYAKVRAMSRIATPDNEARLLDLAYAGTAAHVERVVRAWRRCDRVEEARNTEQRHLGRTVTTYLDDDGMLVLRARLTPELGAVVQRALDAASERLYQDSKDATSPTSVAEEVTAAQRRADALGLLAECALHADLDRGSAADRYQVVVHVEAPAAGASTSQAVIELGDGGVHVSAERHGASHATPPSSSCTRARRVRFWMWGAGLGPSRRRSAGRSPHAMADVGSPNAAPAAAMLTTLRTGATAAAHRSTT